MQWCAPSTVVSEVALDAMVCTPSTVVSEVALGAMVSTLYCKCLRLL